MKTITEITLAEMSRQIAAESPMFVNRLTPSPAGEGVSDLFASACGGSHASENYLFALEYIFEGYLLHYHHQGRLIEADASDFSLLAGDYMYAKGLTYIAALGDLFGVARLADLISLCAHVGAETAPSGAAPKTRRPADDDAGPEDSWAMSAWVFTTLCLAGRAVSGENGRCPEELGPYRASLLANDYGAANARRRSIVARLSADFPAINVVDWISTLAVI